VVPQSSFGDLPGIFKSNGTELFSHDWIVGDVVSHSNPSIPIAAIWTAPFAAVIDIDGSAWKTGDIGRDTHFGLIVNGNLLFEASYLGTSRANPFDFDYPDIPVPAGA
jgi:hypothetical protein